MKAVMTIVLVIAVYGFSFPQSFKSSSSEVSFFSSAPLEDITAKNSKASSLFNAETGEVAFVVPIRGFQFRKSLMQEHFNENYLESDKYPEATFEGRLSGYDLDRSGTQQAVAVGKMTIHGVTRQVKIEGVLNSSSGGLTMQAKFPIRVADYDIDIPTVVFYNIAEVVEVNVRFNYQEI